MFSRQRALIADASTQMQRILMQMLKQNLNFGHVVIADNGKQALKLFETENIDWIFSEWDMPVMDGHQLLLAVRQHPRGKHVPFVLITGGTHKETLIMAMEAGITDFIAKPFSLDILTQKMRNIAASLERRTAERIRTQQQITAKIIFSCGATYDAILENISGIGCCLLHSEALHRGGTVCDEAQLVLNLGAETITVNSKAIRIDLDNDPNLPKPNVRIAFQFYPNNTEAAQKAIRVFIEQYRPQDPIYAIEWS